MTVGPSMNYEREGHGCGIYHSSVHSGRPVIVTAGSDLGDATNTSEIWDFTVPGSQWQLSKFDRTSLYIKHLRVTFIGSGELWSF